MNLSNPFDFAKDGNWLAKILVGSVITYLSTGIFLLNKAFFPLSFVLSGITVGYILRTMRTAIKGEDNLPEWNDVLDLLISGLSWLAIATGFFFAGLSLFVGLLLWGAFAGVINIQSDRFLLWALTSFTALYIYFVLSSAFQSLLMVNFAEEERMQAGFAWLKVIKRYASAPILLTTGWLVSAALCTVASVLPTITLIGLVFTPFCSFFAQVLGARLMGRIWAISGSQKS